MFGSRLNKLGAPSKSPFDAKSLFRKGEEGFYNDIQTYATTYFEDTAGTDTAELEDTIALILDQSQGPTGPELVTNGDFSDGTTGWTVDSPVIFTASSGVATIERNSGTIDDFPRQLVITAGKRYEVEFTVLANSHNVQVYMQGTVAPFSFIASTTGTFKAILLAGSFDSLGFRIGPTGNASATCTIDNVSVKELPGNHLTQATAGARPKLSARYNLLERTEEFDLSPWTRQGTTVTENVVTAPNGSLTADKLIENAVSTFKGVYQGPSATTANSPYTAIIYAKAAERSACAFGIRSSATPASRAHITVDLVSGAVSAIRADVSSYSVESVGDGWFKIQVSTEGLAQTDLQATLVPLDSALTSVGNYMIANYTGDGVSGLYIWGADIRLASDTDQPAYQRVTTATDYDTEGFDPYLQFDLVDDALVATIPAITGGTLVLATRDGIWIDDDINASAGTFSVGPTTYTGGPAGLLSVIGNKLIGPPLLLDRQLTASEKNAVIQWFQSRGAGALYVLGEELVTNGTFDTDSDWTKGTGWTISGGVATKASGNTESLQQSFSAPTGVYLSSVSRTISGGTGVLSIRASTNVNVVTLTGSGTSKSVNAITNITGVWVIPLNTSFAGDIDNISVRELTQPGA